MRTISFCGIVVLVLCAADLFGQTASTNPVRHRAPTDKALDIPLAALQAEFAALQAERRDSTRLIEGGAYSLNARYLNAGEIRDLVHKDIVELYFVREGSGTLVTGGKIVNNKIQGGTVRVVKAGDVVFIPPGVPHGFSTTSGISWLNVHFAGTN
jgi:mannose-6-phosphate isomerase-like protein (cupin superfamily)